MKSNGAVWLRRRCSFALKKLDACLTGHSVLKKPPA
jgi:hypothetical protein